MNGSVQLVGSVLCLHGSVSRFIVGLFISKETNQPIQPTDTTNRYHPGHPVRGLGLLERVVAIAPH
jgi:hypothetical protein